MDRQYRKMFDQALKQLGPEQAQVDALRTELARRCQDGPMKEVIPMKKRIKLLRNALIAAAAIAMLTATGAAVTLGQRQQVGAILGVMDGDNERDGGYTSPNTGVFLLDGRYYFKVTADSEPIDITGQFSDTVPYVYTREMPKDEGEGWSSQDHLDYVIAGSGDRIYCVVTAYDGPGNMGFHGLTMAAVPGSSRMAQDCPIWWRTYCYDHDMAGPDSFIRDMRDGFDTSDLPSNEYYFRWALDSLTVDGQTGAVTLSVLGEERDITAGLAGGGVYLLTVAGTERNTVYRDESMEPDPPDNWPESWTGEYDDPNLIQYWAELEAWDATRIYVPNAHDILAYRDGDEVRYAEFIYRPDGTLRYWMPWNCPTAADLGWLEEYTAQHGWELDWLMTHAYEKGTDALYAWEFQDWPEWLGSYNDREPGMAIPADP